MNGLELSEKFYIQCGAPMIHEQFPHIENIAAAGLCGSGSECFGYDDSISRDHDFQPGFCIFLPDDTDDKTLFELNKAYSRLPREFMGYERTVNTPVGGNRHGAFRISDFFIGKVGTPDGNIDLKDWFFIPEQSLSEAVNGKIFRDDSGELTAVRKRLSYLPEDVRLKKIGGNLLVMGQAGQYNYNRCVLRGDTAAAQLSMTEFVKSALNVIFLLNKKYVPYYKWTFRALKDLPLLSSLYGDLEYLLSSPNDGENSSRKAEIAESVCAEIFAQLREQSITKYGGTEAEGHAYSVNDHIRDNDIRNLHILYGI